MAVIYEDTRQQDGKHLQKQEWWKAHGIEVVRRKLDFGDYATDGANVVVDTKRNVAEIAQNINGRQHSRFKRECERARNAGFRLVVLVENLNGYESVVNVASWENDHCMHCRMRKQRVCEPRNPHGKCAKHRTMKPIQGPRLAKAMQTMQERYGVQFAFCHPRDAARIVCERLGVEYDA